MPQKTAVVNYRKCIPQECKEGICIATLVCKRKVLIQEFPYEMPNSPMVCIGCGDCAQVCPMSAVIMV